MSTMPPRRKGPPPSLKLAMPPKNPQLPPLDTSATMSASTGESALDSPSGSSKPRSLRNMKKLSLSLPSALSSSNSLQIPSEPVSAVNPTAPSLSRPRRPSIISLPTSAKPTLNSTLSNRKEDVAGSGSVPYEDGPIQVIPGIWLGSEDNARDWNCLMERRIKAILNVAKEVSSPFDADPSAPMRSTVSTPDLHNKYRDAAEGYHAPHPASGRPGMHYLKLQWSHGQQNLVDNGFQDAMAFTDAATQRGEGVLIHCQCGISRSATLAIAVVMRAAAERSPSVPSEIWALKGMQGAYSYVKEKSKWIGPNMSLIYQLLDYEKKLKGQTESPGSDRSSAMAEDEDEWARNRKLLDEVPADDEEENPYIVQEAKALDKAMEDRVIARKTSASSLASSTGMGMGPAWRSRYGGRKRTGSVASNMTNTTTISEDLMEDVEGRQASMGSGFESDQTSSAGFERSNTNSPQELTHEPPSWSTSTTARPLLRSLPSAPAWKTTFGDLPPMPATAARSTFDVAPRAKHRMPRLNSLPPVPSSPIHVAGDDTDTTDTVSKRKSAVWEATSPPVRTRVDSKKPPPPPLHLKSSLMFKPMTTTHVRNITPPIISTPSQTLFVFPPSDTDKRGLRTPSTMTLTSNMNIPVPFPPSSATPRVSTFRSHGRTRSFIGVSRPLTTTTGISQVDARGYFGGKE